VSAIYVLQSVTGYQHGFEFKQTWPFWLQRTKNKPSCDEVEEATSVLVNKEVDIDSDDERDLEIERESASEESSDEVRGRVKQVARVLMGGKK
jgi:hypothetical protein